MSLQLIMVNYGNLEDDVKVVEWCKNLHHFDEVTVLHPDPRNRYSPNIMQARSKIQNLCWIYEVPEYVVCDHALSIQWDGYIINESKWDPQYLEYDWIGA